MISPSQKFEKNEDNLLWRFNRAAIEYIDIKFLEDQKDKGAYEKFSHFFHWRFGAFYSFSQWLLICIFLDFLIFCLSIIKFLKLLS